MELEKMNAVLENMIGESGFKVPGLGVIVYKEGKQVYSKFLGARAISGNILKPVTKNTRFRVASVSKMFTVFSLLKLVEQGKINLDEDASQYLSFPLRNPFVKEKITVRMLTCHTSSLRDGKIYSIPPQFSIEEFFSPKGKFFENGAHFADFEKRANEYFCYSNLNYGVLGTIIENVTGKRFDIYQKENILSQLETQADYVPANLKPAEFEMLGTVYQKKNNSGVWNEKGKWYGKADEYEFQPSPDTVSLQNPYEEKFQQSYSLKDYRAGSNATIFSPQGGLRISFEELAKVLEMFLNGGRFRGREILSQNSFEEMLKPQWIYDGKNGDTCGGVFLSYGLGVYFIDGKAKNRLCKDHEINFVGHSGAAFGMLSGLFFVPQTKTGFVYMMNGEAVPESKGCGRFSNNFFWEETITDAVCKYLIV